MHHRLLREVAKVGTGLVLADLISVLLLSGAGFFPLTILGITWSTSAVGPIVIFDIALALILMHVGWGIRLPVQSPSERGLLYGVAVIFLIVSVLHLLRLAFGWDVVLGSVAVPEWISWLGVVIPGYLAYSSFHFARKAHH